MFTIKNHEYDIGFATPLEFSLYLGENFLIFCDKQNNK